MSLSALSVSNINWLHLSCKQIHATSLYIYLPIFSSSCPNETHLFFTIWIYLHSNYSPPVPESSYCSCSFITSSPLILKENQYEIRLYHSAKASPVKSWKLNENLMWHAKYSICMFSLTIFISTKSVFKWFMSRRDIEHVGNVWKTHVATDISGYIIFIIWLINRLCIYNVKIDIWGNMLICFF